ncbi:MAG: T9SS type A sorting domain-containing protein, partial [Ignavibacteria bacterium]|nr:T9SS type A sorting domain-containing protein [Ignavibacteria bacterium]
FFTADIGINNVILSWQTATEVNNSGFEILRYAQDDNAWKNIGFVKGKGTTTEMQDYFFTDPNVTQGIYSYRLKQIDYNGSINFSKIIEVEVNPLFEFVLEQNYPNPFNPITKINFQLAEISFVKIVIFDALGREIVTLVNQEKPAGKYEVEWDASEEPSGIYYYMLKTDEFTQTKKMILMK